MALKIKRLSTLGGLLILLMRPGSPVLAFSVQIIREPSQVRIILPFPIELVWNWSLQALSPYAIDPPNLATQEIVTTWIKEPFNPELFQIPAYFPYHEEVKTRLNLRFTTFPRHKDTTTLLISKDFLYFQNIFDGWRNVESDGVEEYVIGYRIRQLAYYHYLLAVQATAESQKPRP
jgi:hypothetical protein